MIPATPAACSVSMNRGIARNGARCPSPVSNPGCSSSAQASFCWYEGRGAERRTAVATASRLTSGSSSAMMPWITVTGSRLSVSGHLAHRGCPARSREEIRLMFPHAAHGSACGPHTEQYQSRPWRWKVRSCLPHRAQHGGETACAPAWRSATSRSPMARGAGDLPSASTSGRPARADARRRDLARPPATAVATARICSGSRWCSTAATSSVISPIGSDTARSDRPGLVTIVPRRECVPA